SQHSNGDRIAPAAFCRKANLSAWSCVVHTTTPPIPSLWPLRNFVVEWTTMSAPSAIGCWKYGDRNVLSTTNWTFRDRQMWLIAAKSLICIRGFVGVSAYTIRVFLRIARFTFFSSEV